MPAGAPPGNLAGAMRSSGHGGRRSLLDSARRGWSLRPLQRPGLRSHPSGAPASTATRPLSRGARRRARRRALHDRGCALARRRRGAPWRGRHGRRREPVPRPVAPLPLRGPLLARWVHPGSRRGCRYAAPADQRSADRTPAPRPRHDRADARVGTRRARGGRDVELELDDRLAHRHRGPVDRRPPAAIARSGSGLVRRPSSGSVQQCALIDAASTVGSECARRCARREIHLSHRSNWLRAAVLGANDGILSTASLVLGVAASGASGAAIVTAGSAGLVAGAGPAVPGRVDVSTVVRHRRHTAVVGRRRGAGRGAGRRHRGRHADRARGTRRPRGSPGRRAADPRDDPGPGLGRGAMAVTAGIGALVGTVA